MSGVPKCVHELIRMFVKPEFKEVAELIRMQSEHDENERCAKIAESMHSYPVVKLEWDEEGGRHETPAGRGGPGADIASAIRSRQEKP